MQLHPTRATFQVALAGRGDGRRRRRGEGSSRRSRLAARCCSRSRSVAPSRSPRSRAFVPPASRWCGARPAGVTKAIRGEEIVLEAELRNRGFDDARGVSLRPVASSMLEVSIIRRRSICGRVQGPLRDPRSRAARRALGVHGIALEVRGTPLGGEGLYEVPADVREPARRRGHAEAAVRDAAGRRAVDARGASPRAGRPAPLAGEGEHLKELREHVAGDPFKRIAWKASARRGQLLVREMEREERDVAWLVIDASVELWAGAYGTAPLDVAIDELGGVAARHIAKGDRVGVVVFASRVRTGFRPRPARSRPRRSALRSRAQPAWSTPTAASSTMPSSRSASPSTSVRSIPAASPTCLAAASRRSRCAPRPCVRARRSPRGSPTPRPRAEQRFRHYLASFGVEVPPRVEGEREKAPTLSCAASSISSRRRRARRGRASCTSGRRRRAPRATSTRRYASCAHVMSRSAGRCRRSNLVSRSRRAGRPPWKTSCSTRSAFAFAPRRRGAERAMRLIGVKARQVEIRRHGVGETRE